MPRLPSLKFLVDRLSATPRIRGAFGQRFRRRSGQGTLGTGGSAVSTSSARSVGTATAAWNWLHRDGAKTATGRTPMKRIGSVSRSSRKALCLVTAAVIVFGGSALSWAQDSAGQALKDGIDLLRRGRTQEANAKFSAVLAAAPSNQD